MDDEYHALSSLVILPEVASTTVEDIFSSSLNLIAPDGSRNSHGEPGSDIIYRSRRFGEISLGLANPTNQSDRFLMAHYLWNASLQLAELISGFNIANTRAAAVPWEVSGKRVLELGAGTGLASIVSYLSGASEVAVTDHPTPEVLSAIRSNVARNVAAPARQSIHVEGHEWGVVDDDFAKTHANAYNIVIAADCLWISGEHRNLVTSMQHFLSFDADARIWVIAGFHTGRAIISQFIELSKAMDLEVEHVWERDSLRKERNFMSDEKKQENAIERSRWLLIAVMRRV